MSDEDNSGSDEDGPVFSMGPDFGDHDEAESDRDQTLPTSTTIPPSSVKNISNNPTWLMPGITI